MSTLQDLRSTLDAHAAEVTDTVTADRVAAVTSRARVVRRRRAAGLVVAAALAVGAVGVLSLLPGERATAPSKAPGDAPVTMTSLGWSYRVYGLVQDDGGRVSTELEASDFPRLVSWATTGGDQAVEVRMTGGERWASDAVDYGDFVWVPPGFSGQVTMTGPDGLELALYELSHTSYPAGVGAGVETLREDVAGYDQVGAAVGEPGQASVEVPLDTGPGELQIAYACPGLPERGYVVHVGVVGQQGSLSSEGACSYGGGFDPGGSTNVGMPGRWGPGAALRIWVTREGAPLSDGEVPDLRLSLAAYAYEDEPLELAGNQFPQRLEYGGKVFQVVDSLETGPGELPRLAVPEDGDYVVSSWMAASPSTPYSVGIGGTNDDRTTLSSGIEGSGNGAQLVRPGADEVRIIVGGGYVEDVDKAALVLYRRVE